LDLWGGGARLLGHSPFGPQGKNCLFTKKNGGPVIGPFFWAPWYEGIARLFGGGVYIIKTRLCSPFEVTSIVKRWYVKRRQRRNNLVIPFFPPFGGVLRFPPKSTFTFDIASIFFTPFKDLPGFRPAKFHWFLFKPIRIYPVAVKNRCLTS